MSRKRSSRIRIDVAFTDDTAAPAGRLFAVACPGCRGELAVTTDMAGGEACCPTCAAPFTVPEPRIADPVVPRAVPPAETRAAPSYETPAPAPTASNAAAAATPEPVPAADAPSGDAAPGLVAFEPLEPGAATATAAAAPAAEPASSPPGPAELIPDAASTTTAAPEAPRGELEFREPVRSITVGDATIELRRLSPEEKQARRTRRNLLILVVGAAILFALVLALGRR